MPVLPAKSASRASASRALTVIAILYFTGRVIEVLPLSAPSPQMVALEVFSALAFALAHGAQSLGLRQILVFASICLVVGNTLEILGIHTGFPFGHYEFLSVMGPQLLHVPILLGLAYIGMAYVSWTIARLIAGATGEQPSIPQSLGVCLLASFVMTAWDFAQDPVWSTLLHAWRWRDGGSWFGVPLSNFAGWLLTVFLIYAAFSFYSRRRPAARFEVSAAGWHMAVIFYALCAAGNVLQLLRRQPVEMIADATGKLWRASSILGASALVSVLGMGSFALLAWLRIPSSSAVQGDGI